MLAKARRLIALGFVPILLLSLGTFGEPATQSGVLTVCPSGCPYSSISDALSKASSGDTIIVEDGVYTDNIYISEPVNIKGIDKDKVEIHPKDSTQSMITIFPNSDAFEVTLENLTIFNSHNEYEIVDFGGKFNLINSTVINKNSVSLTLFTQDALIQDSEFEGGAFGLVVNGASLEHKLKISLDNTKISNIAEHSIVTSYSDFNMKNSSISGGKLSSTILMGDGVVATIEKSSITDGQGIDVNSITEDHSQLFLKGNTISDNSAIGIFVEGTAEATFENNAIENNEIGIAIGGSAKVVMEGNLVKKNTKWGVALFQAPCYDSTGKFTGSITGNSNEISMNILGDLCPNDFSWPTNFKIASHYK